VKANDTPAAAQDAFTPAIAVDTRGRVGILYYDLRDDTSTKDAAFMTAEWLTTSTNRGRTWSASRRVTPTFDHAAAAPSGGFFLGDYQGSRRRRNSLPAVLRGESDTAGERGARLGHVLYAPQVTTARTLPG
jgi:hypothetical protein